MKKNQINTVTKLSFKPNTVHMLTVVLSHPVVNGFQRHINIRLFDSMKDLCAYIQTQLVSYLQRENLTFLVKQAQCLSLHCHDCDFYSDL